MMTAIKIVFIILLLIPIALLMRRFLAGLSAETPAQVDSDVPVIKRKDRIRKEAASGKGEAASGKGKKMAKSKKSRKKSGASGAKGSSKGKTDKNGGSGSIAEDRPKQGRPAGSDRSYTPRQPEQWQRSERVPFGEAEGYHVDPPKSRTEAKDPEVRQWKKPSDALKEMDIDETARARKGSASGEDRESVAFEKEEKATKKRKRSEKSPSKRQLRKNRERARKRDIKRRKEGRNS